MFYKYSEIVLSFILFFVLTFNTFLFFIPITKAVGLDPIISSISPISSTANNNGFTMTITGNNFSPDSRVYLDDLEKKTDYISSSQLNAFIMPLDITTPGFYRITVVNPNGEKSNIKIFTVNSPSPIVDRISPTSNVAGNEAFTITITGTNFIPGSLVNFNGLPKSTTYVSPTQLNAQILSSDLANYGTYNITAFNPPPGGGTSNSQNFLVNNPKPTIKNIYPASVAISSSKVILIIYGSNFIPSISGINNSGSVIYFNNIAMPTMYNSSSQLTAYIPESFLTGAKDYSVKAYNPAPAGGFSNDQIFSIQNPIPIISSTSVVSANVRDEGFDLNVIGSRFAYGATVNFNGSVKKTNYISSTKLTSYIPSSDLLKAGTYNITVTNPSPGGGESNPRPLVINNRVPVVTNISPKSVILDSAGFTLTVNGLNFVSDSAVNFDGSPRETTYVSSTQLTALIFPSDLTVAGFYNITVTNLAPGGGNSNSQIFTINNPLPFITSMSQDSILAGSPGFFLNVYGNNFTKSTMINFDDLAIVSSYYDLIDRKRQSMVLIDSSKIKNSGIYSVTATNPSPGGGTSNAKIFTIINSTKAYAYSACYFNQCRVFSSPTPLSNSCQTDINCTFP